MSDNAIFVICVTVFMLALIAYMAFMAWLDSPKRMHGGSPKETPQVPPKGGLPPGSGHQPTRPANTANPPRGGSAVTPPSHRGWRNCWPKPPKRRTCGT